MLIGGFEPAQAYIVHFAAVAIGHLNHANIHITWGPLRYVFNNPVMHLWHHVYHLPEGRTRGINFHRGPKFSCCALGKIRQLFRLVRIVHELRPCARTRSVWHTARA